ncbi:Ras guanine nucleotide exchange factor bud5 [Microbotryomycetes sp. JL201]|nr:Ras guanine nucleotide exchange factor bud5 [Microbotryomycetes sp. JL201]
MEDDLHTVQVRALHSFHPPEAVGSSGDGTGAIAGACLAFERGQTVTVLHKDASGWWHGQLEAHDRPKGWFPSNYVQLVTADDRQETALPRTRSVSADSPHHSVAPNAAKDDDVAHATLPAAHPVQAIQDSLTNAITQLSNAVASGRVTHYQPSTACVISAVRTLLSATSCLTRESTTLRSHPPLATSRKQILAALASLVNQARKASAPAGSDALDANNMLVLAKNVQSCANEFLALVSDFDVLVQHPLTIGADNDRKDSIVSIEVGAGTALRHAKSTPDLRPSESASTPPPPLPPKGQRMSVPVFSSIRQNHVISTAHDLSVLTTTIHDALLSTIAAFIGHVHAHSRSSHASSFAQLIDLTRETIERVRDVLVVVEAVSNCAALLREGSDIGALESSRERLYVATTSLVTAARVATSSPLSPSQPSTPNPETLLAAPNADDAEKAQLLTSATGVLRAGGDCISLIKTVLNQAPSSTPLGLVLKSSAAVDSPASSPVAAPVPRRTESGSPSLQARRQNPHTLSMLGRKASSLVPLRDLYGDRVAVEEEAAPVEFQDAPDDGLRRGSETSWHSTQTGSLPMARQGSHASSAGATSDTVTEIGSLSPELGRTNSPTISRSRPRQTHSVNGSQGTTTSVAMSRGDSARTSESAASSRTALSRTSTGDTSPRSSMSATLLPPHLDLTKSVDLSHPALPSPSASSMAALSLRTDASASSARSIGSPVSTMSMTTTTSTSAAASPIKDSAPWFLQRDYDPSEIAFNADGHVTGGTLTSLVERLTLHDTTIDTMFSNTFFLTFRLFATPTSLAEALFARYDIQPPSMTMADGHIVHLRPDELKLWHDRKLTPVRLRVYNTFKTWVESHWSHNSDQPIVEPLLVFCKTKLALSMANAGNRLVELIQKKVLSGPMDASRTPASPVSPVHPAVAQHRGLTRMQSMERFRVGKLSALSSLSTPAPAATVQQGSFGPPPPPPIVSKSLLSSLRYGQASIVDIDPLELARQLTIIESKLYCAIKPGELLGQEFSKKGPDLAVNVRAMSTLSTKLTGWISETILNEHDAKKRTSLLKYYVKLGDRCLTLDNYNTLFAVLSALNSSTIARLRKTWDGLGTKYRTMLDQQRKATEHSRNYAEYRHKIRNAVPPCLPFVGLFLTDITMCIEGNPPERPSPADPTLRLINFDRYQKMARIVGDLKRFQQPYNLAEVAELQQFLRHALDELTHGGDAQSLYRQSLLVEPRDVAPSITSQQTTRSDFFNWRG